MAEEAGILKRKGNEKFVKKEFETAINYYSDALDLILDLKDYNSKDKSILYANRAECFLRLNKFKDAINDCENALKFDNNNIKAKFRRAKAFIALKNYDKAKNDLTFIIKKDKKNIKALDLMREIQRKTNKNNNNRNNNNNKYDPETDVTIDDQNNICQYNILNHLKTNIEDDILLLNTKLNDIRDAKECFEMLIDDDACKLSLGSTFIQISNDNCESLIKKKEKKIKKNIKSKNNKLNDIMNQMSQLRMKLKSKFGDHIGLPEVRPNPNVK